MKKKVMLCFALCVMCAIVYTGCSPMSNSGNTSVSGTEEQNIGLSGGQEGDDQEETAQTQIICSEGTTLETRFAVPEGYERTAVDADSLTAFLRGYELKADDSPVLLYDGSEKRNQNAHAAVFSLPVTEGDLQQCADSVMRVWAEYYWSTGQYDRIAFHFTNGFLCEYSRWMAGERVVVDGNQVSWSKKASYDDSYQTFEKYLRTVFMYAGTLSMDTYEAETIPLDELEVGDVFLKGGSPGHVVMVVDICENQDGEKAFLLGQGYMPAQEFHVINNRAHMEDPWYYETEISFPLQTAEYTFSETSMVKRLSYGE